LPFIVPQHIYSSHVAPAQNITHPIRQETPSVTPAADPQLIAGLKKYI